MSHLGGFNFTRAIHFKVNLFIIIESLLLSCYNVLYAMLSRFICMLFFVKSMIIEAQHAIPSCIACLPASLKDRADPLCFIVVRP